MLELISLAGGFLSPFVKEIVGIWKTKIDYQQEYRMYELQLERLQKEHEYRVEEADIRADIEESKGIYKLQSQPIGDSWIEIFRASVRPVTAYSFLFFYLILKVATYHILVNTPGELPWQQLDPWGALQSLWGKEEYIIFSSIIGYYFSSRSIEKARKYYG